MISRVFRFVLQFGLSGPLLAAHWAAPPTRAVTVTLDDLPAPPRGVVSNDPAALAAMTEKLLAALSARRVPAIGFVTEGKLEVAGEGQEEGEGGTGREARIGVLRQWTAAGFELGNHTWSHQSLNQLPLDEFEADVVRGEPVTRRLLAERGKRLRYFRHPFLHVGLDLDKRRAFEAWLRERGYTVAPVTVDNDEWIFAFLYADALKRGESELAGRIAAEYLHYMDGVFGFIEEVSRNLLGREPAQVLLIHANQLNSDHLGELLDAIAARGYRFVSLEEALADPAYSHPDDYVGAWGISWLHHWEITEGKQRTPSPDPPAWILAAYEKLGG